VNLEFIVPDWPAPAGVRAAVSLRTGGVSAPPFDSLNLGDHVGDEPDAVRDNRRRLAAALGLPAAPSWLQQVHGRRVVDLDEARVVVPEADAAMTARPGRVCAVLTADCLPVLLCRADGSAVAAVHAGWRGLAAGVLESAVAALAAPGEGLMAWLGPAIGPASYEVDDAVRDAFPGAPAEAFRPTRPGHYQADLYALARQRLQRLGVTAIHGGGFCTRADEARFFSYRRDGRTGRFASLIWLEPRP
jgi:hypothetical protein